MLLSSSWSLGVWKAWAKAGADDDNVSYYGPPNHYSESFPSLGFRLCSPALSCRAFDTFSKAQLTIMSPFHSFLT